MPFHPYAHLLHKVQGFRFSLHFITPLQPVTACYSLLQPVTAVTHLDTSHYPLPRLCAAKSRILAIFTGATRNHEA